MNDLMKIKYPKMEGIIDELRSELGYKDNEITDLFSEKMAELEYGGKTTEDINNMFGISEGTAAKVRIAQNENGLETLSNNFGFTGETLKGIGQKAIAVGVDPMVAIADKAGPNILGQYLDAQYGKLKDGEKRPNPEELQAMQQNVWDDVNDVPTRASNGIISGVELGASGMWKGADWLFDWEYAKNMGNTLEKMAMGNMPENPNFFDQVANGVGTSVFYLLPGLMVSKSTAVIAKFSPSIAKWLGASSQGVTEGLSEAGFVYDTVYKSTGDRRAACAAASKTFWLNVPMNIVTDKLTYFSGSVWNKVLRDPGVMRSRVARFAENSVARFLSEGTQETYQGAVSTNAESGGGWFGWLDSDWGELARQEGLVGGVSAIITGGIAQNISHRYAKPEAQTEAEPTEQKPLPTEETKVLETEELLEEIGDEDVTDVGEDTFEFGLNVREAETPGEQSIEEDIIVEDEKDAIDAISEQNEMDMLEAEKAKDRLDVLSWIRKNGGLSYEAIKRGYGETEAKELLGRLGPGAFRKDSHMGLDTAAQGLQAEGIGVMSDEGGLYKVLMEKQKFNTREVNKVLSGEMLTVEPPTTAMLDKAPADTRSILNRVFGTVKLWEVFTIEGAEVVVEGVVESRKVGEKAGKTRQKEIHKAEKTRKTLRQLTKKMALQITKMSKGKSILARAGADIAEVLEGYDLAFRSKKNTVPGVTNLSNMTIQELSDLHELVSGIYESGREGMKQKKAQEKAKHEAQKAELLDVVGRPDPTVPTTAARQEEKKRGKIPTLVESLIPRNVLDMLDGLKDHKGPFCRMIDKGARQARSKFAEFVNNRKNNMLETLKKNGLTAKALQEIRWKGTDTRGGKLQLTLSELMGVYWGMENEKTRMHMEVGMAIPETLFEDLSNGKILTDKERAQAEAYGSDMESTFDRVAPVAEKSANVIMKKAKRYMHHIIIGGTSFQNPSPADTAGQEASEAEVEARNKETGEKNPLIRYSTAGVAMQTVNETEARLVADSERGRSKYVKRSSTKERIAKWGHPIVLDLHKVWSQNMEETEYYIAFADLVKDLNATALSGEVIEAVKQRYGATSAMVLKDYVNRISDPTYRTTDDGFGRALRVLRTNAFVTYLSASASTMFKQIPSVLFAMGQGASPRSILYSMNEFILNPHACIDEMHRLDPLTKERSIDYTMSQINAHYKAWERGDLKNIPKGILELLQTVGKKGLAGISAMDLTAVTIAWRAVYMQTFLETGNKALAIDKAQRMFLSTQPNAHPHEMPYFMANASEAKRMLMVFTNQLNKIWNMEVHHMPAKAKRAYRFAKQGQFSEAFGEAESLAMTIMAIGLSQTLIWAIQNGKLPEDPGEVAEAFTAGALSTIPLVGRTIASGYTDGMDSFLIQKASMIGSLMGDIEDAFKTGRIKNGSSDVKALLELASLGFGLPYTGASRLAQFAETGDALALFLGRGAAKKSRK